MDAHYFEKIQVDRWDEHAGHVTMPSGLAHVLTGQLRQRHPWTPPDCPLKHLEKLGVQASDRQPRVDALRAELFASINEINQRYEAIESTWNKLENSNSAQAVLAILKRCVQALHVPADPRQQQAATVAPPQTPVESLSQRARALWATLFRGRQQGPQSPNTAPQQASTNSPREIAQLEQLVGRLSATENRCQEIRLDAARLNYLFDVTGEILGQFDAGSVPSSSQTTTAGSAQSPQHQTLASSAIWLSIWRRLTREAGVRHEGLERQRAAQFWLQQIPRMAQQP